VSDSHEPLRSIDAFYILDLDRCLVHTEKLQALLEHIIERELAITSGGMDLARREYEKMGGSFDAAGYVMEILDGKGIDGPALWVAMKRLFIREARAEDMLEPYARTMLTLLREKKKDFGIVTFGGDAWQLTKMAAAGLDDIPHIVTHDQAKGRMIASWQRSDGSFLLPRQLAGRPTIARELFFIDDKPVSFDGIPPEVRAICAVAPGAVWPDRIMKKLPSTVSVTKGLHGAIELLFNHKKGIHY
jgi:hypothetical protein